MSVSKQTMGFQPYLNSKTLQPHLTKRSPVEDMELLVASDSSAKQLTPPNEEPNPPVWPKSVIIITPDMSPAEVLAKVQHTQDPVEENKTNPYKEGEVVRNASRHFVEDRSAILFAPGVYHGIDVQIGYYVQLAGLGARAEDVVFKDCEFGPYCPALRKWELIGGHPGLSLDTFWRVAENYKTEAKNGQLWAVSQAAPIRRVHVVGDLNLHDAGAQASGGHMANCIVEGNLSFGSQQQWCSRSVTMNGGHDFTVYSSVFVDCVGGPKESFLQPKDGNLHTAVTVDVPNVTVEKPFVVMKEDKKTFELRVPSPRFPKDGQANGADLIGTNDDVRDFTNVRIAVSNNPEDGQPDLDVANKINHALKEGKDIILSPGMYHLSKPLEVIANNQVILGLGLATLVAPKDGSPCIKVSANTEGVRLAGMMFEASNIPDKKDRNFTSSFIEFGEEGRSDDGNPENPGVLTDIFARVGGSSLDRSVSTDVMIRIHSGNVLGDNLWLWRADHVALADGEPANVDGLDYHQTTVGEVPVGTGLVVTGNDVTIHGLAVEHTTEHQVIWKGNKGNVQFYQCELPYDVNEDFGTHGYRGYKVEAASHHTAGGAGVYSNFRDFSVPVKTAIEHPSSDHINFVNPFTLYLNNKGTMQSVVNGNGGSATIQGQAVYLTKGE